MATVGAHEENSICVAVGVVEVKEIKAPVEREDHGVYLRIENC